MAEGGSGKGSCGFNFVQAFIECCDAVLSSPWEENKGLAMSRQLLSDTRRH